MLNQGIVGQPAKQGNGTTPSQRMGAYGDSIMSQLHGRYYEQALNGNMFVVANQAAVSTTAALATTWTGLAISNPAGSGINISINMFMCAQVAVGAAGAIGIMTGTGAAAGALTPRNCLVGGRASLATASAGATIATPILERVFGSVGSLATTGYGLQNGLAVDLGGSLILQPGYFAATYTTAATTTSMIFGFMWEEIPF